MVRVWTKYQNEQLERLWKNGLSISKIASEMGRTRNQVIGRAHDEISDKEAGHGNRPGKARPSRL